jgi:hypothetical protein
MPFGLFPAVSDGGGEGYGGRKPLARHGEGASWLPEPKLDLGKQRATSGAANRRSRLILICGQALPVVHSDLIGSKSTPAVSALTGPTPLSLRDTISALLLHMLRVEWVPRREGSLSHFEER